MNENETEQVPVWVKLVDVSTEVKQGYRPVGVFLTELPREILLLACSENIVFPWSLLTCPQFPADGSCNALEGRKTHEVLRIDGNEEVAKGIGDRLLVFVEPIEGLHPSAILQGCREDLHYSRITKALVATGNITDSS